MGGSQMSVLIVAGGPDPGAGLIRKMASGAERIYCADRGAQWVYHAGLKPDIAIGDMDSVNRETLEKIRQDEISMLKYPSEKDQTDTELAIEVAVSDGAKSIILLGGLGGRMDHTLANIEQMKAWYKKGIRITIMSADTAMFIAERTVTFRAMRGSYVSLFPQNEGIRVMNSEGLYYPLKDVILPTDTTLCISNQMTPDHVIMDIRNGAVLIVVTANAD